MVIIQLTEKQKKCKHKALKVRASTETYSHLKLPKAEVVCADCDVLVARAGTIWINRKEAIQNILKEHYPALLKKEVK